MKIKNIIFSLLASVILSGCASSKHFVSVEGYRDTRGMNTATLSGGASNLPLGASLFGFIDVETEKQNKDNLKRPYGEIRLSKKAENGLGISAEYNRNFALPKGTTRLGFVCEPKLSKLCKDLFLGVKYFPTSSGNHGSQLGIYGKKTFNKGDFYIGGYWDYNFKPDKIVSDIQFGKRIKDNIYFIVEGRYNDFKNKKNKKGIGMGLEWKF
jgi:hypothetical protein